MQQPLFVRTNVEVTGLAQVTQIGRKQQTVSCVPPEILVLGRHQEKPAKQQQYNAEHQQRGQNPPCPRQVKLNQRKSFGLQRLDDDSRHQQTGNHEEHIHPNKAATQPWHTEVIQHHDNDSPSAQTIDVCTKA